MKFRATILNTKSLKTRSVETEEWDWEDVAHQIAANEVTDDEILVSIESIEAIKVIAAFKTKLVFPIKDKNSWPYPYATDVHTEHCCQKHKRCKYGQEDQENNGCTVAQGTKPASYSCNCEYM